jgi:hypothetical protein
MNEARISSSEKDLNTTLSYLLPPLKQNTAAVREAPKRQVDRMEERGDSGGA